MWWWAWVVFVIVVLLLPWSDGWGRRGWGPPCPRPDRRRARARPDDVAAEPADADPYDPTVPPMRA